MDGIAAFSHVEAGGFDAGRSIRTGNIKLGNPILLNEGGKSLAGQGIVSAFQITNEMGIEHFTLPLTLQEAARA